MFRRLRKAWTWTHSRAYGSTSTTPLSTETASLRGWKNVEAERRWTAWYVATAMHTSCPPCSALNSLRGFLPRLTIKLWDLWTERILCLACQKVSKTIHPFLQLASFGKDIAFLHLRLISPFHLHSQERAPRVYVSPVRALNHCPR